MILDSQPYLLPAILQAFMYALYLVSFFHVLRWLLYDEEGWKLKRCDKVNWSPLAVALVVFVFATADMAFAIAAQILFMDGNVIARQQITIASISLESVTLLITDAVLVRYSNSMSWRIICFPLILWIANILCVVNLIINFTLWVFVSEVPYHFRLILFLRMYYLGNFITNLYITSAIFYRVRRVARENGNRQSSNLYHICRMVVTTGILYTCTSLPQVVTAFYITNHLGAYILCDAINFSMAGITFNLFLIRLGQLRSEWSGMDTERGTQTMSASVLLTTVQFVSTFETNGTDANLGEKVNR